MLGFRDSCGGLYLYIDDRSTVGQQLHSWPSTARGVAQATFYTRRRRANCLLFWPLSRSNSFRDKPGG